MDKFLNLLNAVGLPLLLAALIASASLLYRVNASIQDLGRAVDVGELKAQVENLQKATDAIQRELLDADRDRQLVIALANKTYEQNVTMDNRIENQLALHDEFVHDHLSSKNKGDDPPLKK